MKELWHKKSDIKKSLDSYFSVPEDKRFGITVWGLRDVESWLLNFHNNSNEYPLPLTKTSITKLPIASALSPGGLGYSRFLHSLLSVIPPTF